MVEDCIRTEVGAVVLTIYENTTKLINQNVKKKKINMFSQYSTIKKRRKQDEAAVNKEKIKQQEAKPAPFTKQQ